ncbi:MAG: methionine biosynthesis protein MetW [Kiritimatiellae bacterium]|nr:methionine biosynthesis protein MetW [Kiritimatiellia bacterium]
MNSHDPHSAAVARAGEVVLAHVDPALSTDAGAELTRLWTEAMARHPEASASDGRWQDALIEREIPRGASVLDLGCGSGELLERLIRERGAQGQGIELDAGSVMCCVARGVPVFQSDLDAGLSGFPNHRFDFVVLEETLQTLHKPLEMLAEMLRVGRTCIVSFPNFGHWRVRLALSLHGRMPVTPRLPHRWHNTPNIHLCTLDDFMDWARESRVRVHQGYALSDGVVRTLAENDNLHAEEVLLFLTPER